jgi:hypothetical protein
MAGDAIRWMALDRPLLPPLGACLAWLQETLDYDALRLQPFYAGALVRFQGQFHTVADPLRWVGQQIGLGLGHVGRAVLY